MDSSLISEKHRKYRLIEKHDSYTIVQDVYNDLTHSYVKLEGHEIGDEFYLYIKGRHFDDEEKFYFEYSVLNNYEADKVYTFDIVEEKESVCLISNCL